MIHYSLCHCLSFWLWLWHLHFSFYAAINKCKYLHLVSLKFAPHFTPMFLRVIFRLIEHDVTYLYLSVALFAMQVAQERYILQVFIAYQWSSWILGNKLTRICIFPQGSDTNFLVVLTWKLVIDIETLRRYF